MGHVPATIGAFPPSGTCNVDLAPYHEKSIYTCTVVAWHAPLTDHPLHLLERRDKQEVVANARPPMSAEPEQKRLCKRQRTDKLGGNSLVRERKSEGAMSTNSDGVADMMADVVVDEVSQGQSGTRQISRSHDLVAIRFASACSRALVQPQLLCLDNTLKDPRFPRLFGHRRFTRARLQCMAKRA